MQSTIFMQQTLFQIFLVSHINPWKEVIKLSNDVQGSRVALHYLISHVIEVFIYCRKGIYKKKVNLAMLHKGSLLTVRSLSVTVPCLLIQIGILQCCYNSVQGVGKISSSFSTHLDFQMCFGFRRIIVQTCTVHHGIIHYNIFF